MKNFLNYLNSNNFSFVQNGDQIYIDGDTYSLAIVNDDAYFTENFHLDVKPFETDYCVLLLGTEYYRIRKGAETDPVIENIRYLGQSTDQRTNSFLGVHGAFEICNGTRLYEDWVKKAKFMGIKSLGICEKNTLAGLLKFQLACQAEEIRPILGATYSVYRKQSDLKYNIKCFVQNQEGYQNLLWINTQVNVINHGYVEEQDLLKHAEGISFILDPKSLDHEDIFPLDLDFCQYYQLDTVNYEKDDEYVEYFENLKKYIEDERLQPVAMADAYYLDQRDYYIKDKANQIHQVFEKRATNQYLKSKTQYYEELKNIFADPDRLFQIYGKALVNEGLTVDSCHFTLPLKKRHLPEYKMTKNEKKRFKTNHDLFWAILKKGLASKVKKDHQKYIDRLKKEYNILLEGGIIDYFLILWDIVSYCERNHILIGVGRGSAGGSLVAYLMDIIKIDPLKYGLIFERFLNPGRIKVSLPDIDIDFPSQYRDQVKHYIEKRYGIEYVCSVGTYSNLKLRSLLKDLARQKNIPAYEMDMLTPLLDDDNSTLTGLISAAVKKPRLREFIYNHPDIIDAMPLLLNQPRSQSIHASAVIIVPNEQTVFETFPVKKMQKGKETFIVSEFEGEDLDKLGYLKEDILGITQLDKFQFVIDQVYNDTGERIDLYNLPLDDDEVFTYFQKGWNGDVFHFGSPLLQDYCKRLYPTEINHLISANALMRPGPMDNKFHEQYLRNKNAPEFVEYFEGLKDITKDTYGLVVYQEQVMQICYVIASFNMEDSDSIRKAIGKKIIEILDDYKKQFIQGAVDNKYEEEYALKLWNMMVAFAAYAFNKSHATAYAIMGYYCQYLKVHYPIYFWTASFKYRSEQKAHELMPRFISEIIDTGVVTLTPANINQSEKEIKFDISSSIIYWTLGSIFFCGDTAIDQILNDRKDHGKYTSFLNFLERNIYNGSKVNKRTIENMTLSGAFDELENIKSPKQRLKLIHQYRDFYNVKVDKRKDWLHNSDYPHKDWYFQYLQKVYSEFGFIDYVDFLASLGCDDYLPYEDLITDEYLGDEVTIGGYVVNVYENECKNGVFAYLLLDINYQFINVLLWPDVYEKMMYKGSNLKRKLMKVNGILEFNERRNTNIIKSNSESLVTIIL